MLNLEIYTLRLSTLAAIFADLAEEVSDGNESESIVTALAVTYDALEALVGIEGATAMLQAAGCNLSDFDPILSKIELA